MEPITSDRFYQLHWKRDFHTLSYEAILHVLLSLPITYVKYVVKASFSVISVVKRCMVCFFLLSMLVRLLVTRKGDLIRELYGGGQNLGFDNGNFSISVSFSCYGCFCYSVFHHTFAMKCAHALREVSVVSCVYG